MLPVYKIGILGDRGVGKTALISRFRLNTFTEEFDPTIKDSYTVDMGEFKLEILDTVGADEYVHLRDGWIRSNEGFILVYSISSKSSFTRIQGLYDEIQQVKKPPYPHTSSQVPIMLVGNKIDIAEREVSLLEGKEMARILGCGFVEASAKNGRNVDQSCYILGMQLRTLQMEQALLDDLIDSPRKWHDLLDNLERAIALSQIYLAFGDIVKFLSAFHGKIRRVEQQTKLMKIMARAAIDIEESHIGADVGGSEIGDNEGTPTAEKADEVSIAQEAKKTLDKCQELCGGASFEVIQRGESREIQEMKDEFQRAVNTATKLR